MLLATTASVEKERDVFTVVTVDKIQLKTVHAGGKVEEYVLSFNEGGEHVVIQSPQLVPYHDVRQGDKFIVDITEMESGRIHLSQWRRWSQSQS